MSPRWRDYYLGHDQTPHYAYLKTVLQILQWQRPGERWVLKSPQHLEQLGPLLATFPDATVVVTHRDPVSVVQSAATMMTYAARMSYRTPDPDFYLSYWTDRIGVCCGRSLRDRHLVARRPLPRRAVPRIHGRRPGHRRPHLRQRRPVHDRPGPGRDRSVPGRPSPGPRKARSSTTCGSTSGCYPRRCASCSASTTMPCPSASR